MTTVEQKLLGKFGDLERCEDAIVVTDDYAVIIDGVTSKSARLWDGKTVGKMAAEVLSEAVTHIPKDADAKTAIHALNEAISQKYKDLQSYDLMKDHQNERFCASILLYSNARKEVWIYGDAQCLIGEIIYKEEQQGDSLFAEIRSFFLQTELLKGKTIEELQEHDTGGEFIQPLFERQKLFLNNNNGSKYFFKVIDGFDYDFPITTITVKNDEELVLASDGYPKIFKTLDESESYLQKIITEDPLCIKDFLGNQGIGKGKVSFDDRAYLRIKP